MKKRICAFFLAFCLLLTLFGDLRSLAAQTECPYCEYTLAEDGTLIHAENCMAEYAYDGSGDVGKYVRLSDFSVEYNVMVSGDPVTDSGVYFYYDEFVEGTVMRIADWYWNPGTAGLWYQVEFYVGGIVEEALEYWPETAWVLQNYTENWLEEENALTFVSVCDICGGVECQKTHLYCLACEKFGCELTHQFCGYCNDYDCGIDHLAQNKPAEAPVIPEEPVLTEGAEVSITDESGDAVTDSFILGAGRKSSLSAWTDLEGEVSYQWQIRVEDQWIDIQGQTEQGILVSPAMFLSVAEDGRAVIRCAVTGGEEVRTSGEIAVILADEPEMAAFAMGSGGASQTEGGTELQKVNLIVEYKFVNNTVAANPWTAELTPGNPINEKIKLPVIPGYLPTFVATSEVELVEEDGSYYLQINYADGISEDTSLPVTYQPTNVNVTVLHYWQNVDNDGYTLAETENIDLLTNTTVGNVHHEYPGFYNLLYEKPVVAADGSTMVEVYYDRYYYLMKFDLGGGYGVDPIYARYGADISDIGKPTRAGYEFLGWQLDGADATIPATIPNENRTYVAKWQALTTTYDVVFWYENADNDLYAQAGVLEDRSATSGTIVNGSSYANTNFEGRDSTHFTYSHADENVEVEGDGSTVVNVYFTRNVYDLTFVMEGTADNCDVPIHSSHTDYTGDCYTLACDKAHVHVDGCNRALVCGLTPHEHTDSCRTCGFAVEHTVHTDACLKIPHTEHLAHTDDCLSCTQTVHTHGESCCTLTKHEHTTSCCNKSEGVHFFVHMGGWNSEYCNTNTCSNGGTEHDHSSGCVYCNLEEHSHTVDCYDELHAHTDECYSDKLHTHSDGCYNHEEHTHDEDCYTYQCGVEEHTHVEACYKLTCDHLHYHSGDTCYLVITRKYDASIADVWKEAPVSSLLEEGYVFQSNKTGDYYSFLEKMPGYSDLTLTSTQWSGYYHQWFYYLEIFPGMDTTGMTTRTDGNKTYYLYDDTIVYGGSDLRLTYDEDYFPITGFDQRDDSVPSFSSEGSGDNKKYYAYLYYTRNSYTLTFSNNGEIVSGKGGTFKYEQDISGQYFEPAYPSTLEEGAYKFDGWYTSSFFGDTKFDFATENGDGTVTKATMPAEDIRLYAKWVPITRTVRFFLDRDDYVDGITIPNKLPKDPYITEFATKTVSHGAYLTGVDTPEVADGDEAYHPYSQYDFIGWYYLEDGEEKRFEPGTDGLPVTDDLDLYAKWSSNVLRAYTIYYVLDEDKDGVRDANENTFVADPITGSTLAGNSRTFDAKGDTALYPVYREGYYPNVVSHTITVSIDDPDHQGANTYTFLYTEEDPVPYTVKYLIKGTETPVPGTTEKRVEGNTKAVVTENFVPVSGYMPDAYQKTLVITPNGDNTLIFWYTKDEQHALYQINHYIQNLDGTTWTEYDSNTFTGDIGADYSAEPFNNIDGFVFSAAETDNYNVTQNKNGYTGETLPSAVGAYTGGKVTGTLTGNGMQLNLYYTRIAYPYQIYFLEYGSNRELKDTINGSAAYGALISHTAESVFTKTDEGIEFELYDTEPETKTVTIMVDKLADGTVTYNKIVFYYKRCTQDLTVTKTVTGEGADLDQTFDFTVTIDSKYSFHQDSYAYGDGKYLSPVDGVIRFSLKHGESITIQDLPTAEYTVTEVNLPLGYYADFDADTVGEQASKDIVLTKDDNVTVACTNTYDPANLTITKTVSVVEENGNVPEVADFAFTIRFPDGVTPLSSYSYTVGEETRTATVADGKMTIELQKGQTATFLNLPLGTYTVEEADYSAQGYNSRFVVNSVAPLAEINAVEVDMVRGETQAVECINAFPVGDLIIEKTVTKEFFGTEWNGDTFTFIVERTTAGRSLVENNKYDVYEGENKIGTATVADGELQVEIEFTAADATTLQAEGASVTHTLTIKNLPAGDYSVTEKETTAGIGLYNTSVGVGDDATKGTAVSGLEIPAEETKATFTNQLIRKTGDLYLEKILEAATGFNPAELPKGTKFSFTIQLLEGVPTEEQPFAVTYSPNQYTDNSETATSVTMSGDQFTVILEAGQNVTVAGLPEGKYRITEATIPSYANSFAHKENGTWVKQDSTTTATGQMYTEIDVPADGTAEVKCTNTYPVDRAELIIQKLVTKEHGRDTLPNDIFTFTVTLAEEDKTSYSYTIYNADKTVASSGTAPVTDKTFTVMLKAGQYVVVPDMPVCGYTVVESADSDYTTSYAVYVTETGDSASTEADTTGTVNDSGTGGSVGGTFSAGKTDTVVFTNEYKQHIANLTIDRNGAEDGQIFVYEVENTATHDIITVTVVGNGSTTIYDLPLGTYTVNQKVNWSWRYDKDEVKTVTLPTEGKIVTFGQTWIDYWLGGCSNLIKNIFGGS